MRLRSVICHGFGALFLLCLVLWAGSYWRTVSIIHNGTRMWYGGVGAGRVALCQTLASRSFDPGWKLLCWRPDDPDRETETYSNWWWGKYCLGFRIQWLTLRPGTSMRFIAVPLWFPTLLFGWAWLYFWRKTRKRGMTRGFPVEMGVRG